MELIKPTEQSVLIDGLPLGLSSVSNQLYHADRKYLSSSVLKTILKSLDEYREQYLEGKKKEHSERTLAAFAEGSYFHSRILEPELVATEYAIYNGWRKQGEAYEAFKACNNGKTILSLPQVERVEKLIAAYNRNTAAVELFTGGFPEFTLTTILHGVPVKVRADYVNLDKGYIVDLKTTGSGSDVDSVKQTCSDFSYPLSGSLYADCFAQHFGRPFDFILCFASRADDGCELYKLGEATRQKGRGDIIKACNKYKRAVATGIWTEGPQPYNPVHEIIEI